MIWTDLYLSIGWHIVICIAVFIWGLINIFSDDGFFGIILIAISIIYFLFAPYSHKEQIGNCRTEKGNTVSVIVKFKEPIIKLIFKKPQDVKVISIEGEEVSIELEESPNLEVYSEKSFGNPNPSNKLKLSVFKGYINGRNDTLYLIL